MIKEKMFKWLNDLWPICRSITGKGVRETLIYLKDLLPDLKILEVSSGYQAFDWTVPDEWNIHNAWIEDEKGNRIIDFKNNNLHVVGYSVSVNKFIDLATLQSHLFSLPNQPDAIPYVTSYYSPEWGFCLSHNQRNSLKSGLYKVFIDSELKPGVMNFGEVILSGENKKEVLLSTYICHPSMANNELSGPVVTAAIVQWLKSLPRLRYTYRILFIPETIGSIVYLSKNLDHLKQNVIAGFNITCVGDDNCYSFLPSRAGDTLSDRIAIHVLKNIDPGFKKYSWLDRGSDERQYCAPGVDLPIATIMRSKYGEYPEYHTSLDNLSFVTATGLEGGFLALKKSIESIELNCIPIANTVCEPFLSKRKLYPTLSKKNSAIETKNMMNFLTYTDGKKDLIEISNIINVPVWKLTNIVEKLKKENLIKII
jgi:aminopeptidase-like protein